MKRRLTLLVFLILAHALQAQQKPNILYIMADDHTAQAWGLYGGILAPYVKNENISRIRERGALLKNVFCTNSICVPSRAAIISGQYSHRNGVYDLGDSFSPDSNNVAKELKTAGYTTAIVGKWHLKKEPTGFDYYMVLPGQGRYHDPILKTKDNWQDANAGGKPYAGFSSDVIREQSIEWLEQRDKSKPFMLMTHFKSTHEPFDYPERYKDYLEDVTIPEPDNLYDEGKETTGRSHDGWSLDILAKRFVNNHNGHYPGGAMDTTGLSQMEIRQKTYQRFVKSFLRSGAAVDENIGKLLDYLEAHDLLENTIVIYTADQGYFMGEHSFFDKRFIYEQSARMPFVISYPKEIPAGSTNEDLLLNVDFAPTLMDYAGLAKNPEMQGQSFRNNLKGSKSENHRKSIYYRYWESEPLRPAHLGIRTDRYKLVLFYGQKRKTNTRDKMDYPPAWELYDLKNDPGENHNVYGEASYKKVVKKLKKELAKLKKQYGDSDEEHPIIQEILKENW
ncbi:sulfatase [Marinilongibacter aquaticus]|uniref:sulfatase family protein n=1 Tax=Marinilongibacter aquaticus TaxID=2975157 RepID=UPI0021BD77CC|nr:sulfatase [Marinilongibacter aquaticus]UBM60210.1 sulfatase [Marinilongibacter aquaticus]